MVVFVLGQQRKILDLQEDSFDIVLLRSFDQKR